MSAILIKKTEYGDDASFFWMSNFNVQRRPPQVTIYIQGYASEEAFNAGAKHKVVREYILEGDWLYPYLNDLENSIITVSQLFEFFYTETVGKDSYFDGATRI